MGEIDGGQGHLGDTWDSSVILEAAKGSNLTVGVSTFFDEGDKSASGAKFVTDFKAWLNANADKKTNNGGNDGPERPRFKRYT